MENLVSVIAFVLVLLNIAHGAPHGLRFYIPRLHERMGRMVFILETVSLYYWVIFMEFCLFLNQFVHGKFENK